MVSTYRLLPTLVLCAAGLALAQEKKLQPFTPGGLWRAHDLQRPKPPVVTPPALKPAPPPADAIVLFDGKDLSKWRGEPRKDAPEGGTAPRWKVADGYLEITPKSGGLRTREKFAGDGHLHLEWATPKEVVGKGQGRGNSGVFLGGFPEVQVLDSWQNDTYADGQAAAFYGHYPPTANASRPPGEWQSYDIFFERARPATQDRPARKARITVLHNGVLVQYQREFDSLAQEGDLFLQDHSNPVRFRNIWLRPLRAAGDAKAPESAKTRESASVQSVKIRTMTAQMRYDLESFTVRPGASVRLEFENGDDLPHNLVFCQPGTDTAAMALKQMEKPEEALQRNWLPDDPRIWLHSAMLNPHQSEELRFTAPAKPGDYPYVCTFPGHALTMRGVMKVLPLGGGLQDLHYALYLGAWQKLPDFSKLKPHREGRLEDNLVQLKLDDYKNEFGVVYTGKLQAPRTGNYRFYLGGDDGVRLLIDGRQVVEHDGIHPVEIREGSVKLEAGPHAFRLEYFQAQGQTGVFAAWKGATFDITPLSLWKPKDWEKGAPAKKKADFEPIPLVVKDEPIVYRNFIAGAGNRGLGVGYPGGFNLAWDAETMNLAVLWRGAFLDASRHWNSRGGGHQPPLGYDVVQPAPGVPLARLATPDAAWPEAVEGYVWQGYRLDARRQPVLTYTWNGLRIREHYETEGQGTRPDGRLRRVLELDAEAPAGTVLRLAVGRLEAAADGRFLVEAGKAQVPERQFENRLWIRAPGAQVQGNELRLPVAGRRITIEYAWTN